MSSESNPSGLKLESGSRIGVIGGGPAGSFFSYFLLNLAQRAGIDIHLDIYEPRDFALPGPTGCNMCGGIVSESLVQILAAEGINLPPTVVQRGIDSYTLHMDLGSVQIETPAHEKRIAAVHRGSGPRDIKEMKWGSFDRFLQTLAVSKGAHAIRGRVDEISFKDGRPEIKPRVGLPQSYDLIAIAVGINSATLKMFQSLGLGYQPPQSTKTYICEYNLGEETIEKYLGRSMHVFLLNMPRLEFAAIIPKGDYVTVCLLGDEIDSALIQSFLESPEVKRCFPQELRLDQPSCHCSPRISVQGAVQPFADRIVFIGDSGVTRLFKDGIGAAYRTAKAAATTAVFHGVSAADFRAHYWPACQIISTDNKIGQVIFAVTRLIQKIGFLRHGVLRMVAKEQKMKRGRKRMSMVLWDTFTGSAPYRDIFVRTLHPAFLARFFRDIVLALPLPKKEMLSEKLTEAGALGQLYRNGEVIVRKGDVGDCMYVIQAGKAEVLDGRNVRLTVLSENDFFGEMAIFEGEVRSATVRALGDVRTLTVDKKTLLRRIQRDPSPAFRILQGVWHRIRRLSVE